MEALISGVFGGAFDPVHFGHIKPALDLVSRPQVGQLRFVPCGRHPYEKPMAPAEHRVRMLELVGRTPSTSIDVCAVKDESLLFTADLMARRRREHGAEAPLAFVLGRDSYLDFKNWERGEEILGLAHLIVLARPSDCKPESDGASLDELTRSPCGLTHFFDNRECDVSSTRVRDMLRTGRQPRGMIPGTVWNYIRRNGLYGVH